MIVDSTDPLADEYAKMLGNHNRMKILSICINETPQTYLHKILRISRTLVCRYISELEDMGLITIIKRNGFKVIKTEEKEITFRILPFSADASYNKQQNIRSK